jgi:glutathione S-transferase
MMLIGHYDSPYVRRAAAAMTALGIAFSRNPLSVFSDAEALRQFNPLGRVPALVLDDGEVVIDSGAILDEIDQLVGPPRALVPPSGPRRRRALRLMALATGINDKAVALASERLLRPAQTRHQPWIDRLRTQLNSALLALEAETPEAGWLLGDGQPSSADYTVACMLAYVRLRAPDVGVLPPIPRLAAHSRRTEALPEMQACRPTAEEVGGQEADASIALRRFLGEA